MTCPMHNNKVAIIDTNSLLTIRKHVQQLHTTNFLRVPTPTLNNICWPRCCTTCNYITNENSDLTTHQQSCLKHTTLLNEPPPDYSKCITWEAAFHMCMCPAKCHSDLTNLIHNTTDRNAKIADILNKALDWFNIQFLESQTEANTNQHE
jgi:hypothetical protein